MPGPTASQAIWAAVSFRPSGCCSWGMRSADRATSMKLLAATTSGYGNSASHGPTTS